VFGKKEHFMLKDVGVLETSWGIYKHLYFSFLF